jgi:hypothetical protein
MGTCMEKNALVPELSIVFDVNFIFFNLGNVSPFS